MAEEGERSNGNELKVQVKNFVWYGIMGGIAFPFVITFLGILLDLNKNIEFHIAEDKGIWVIIVMVTYFVIAQQGCINILIKLTNDSKENRDKRISKLLSLMGFVSLIVLYLIILWTGGSVKSPFSGYLIYIPVVVLITFDNIKIAVKAALAAMCLAIISTPAILGFIPFLSSSPAILGFIPFLSNSYKGIDSSNYIYQYYCLSILCWLIMASIFVSAPSKIIIKVKTFFKRKI